MLARNKLFLDLKRFSKRDSKDLMDVTKSSGKINRIVNL